jgi:hypothetical protein
LAGNTINYTLTVDAQGPATSTGVVATDTFRLVATLLRPARGPSVI